MKLELRIRELPNDTTAIIPRFENTIVYITDNTYDITEAIVKLNLKPSKSILKLSYWTSEFEFYKPDYTYIDLNINDGKYIYSGKLINYSISHRYQTHMTVALK